MMWCARLLLLALLPALAGEWACVEGEVVSVVSAAAGARGPVFEAGQRTELVVAAGQPAALACRLRNLHDKTVSWVRSRDLAILCHAGAPFAADARVSCAASAGVGPGVGAGVDADVGVGAGVDARLATHSLRLAEARVADSGRYECQLNTEPKMSLFFNLTVVEEQVPRVVVSAVVAGGAGRAVRGAVRGAATLACEARYSPRPRRLPAPPLRLLWAKDGAPLDAQSVRGGVSLESESEWGGARVTSRLTLTGLTARDAGRYTCRAAPLPASAADTVTLTVVERDDDPLGAALESMQRDAAAASGAPRPRPPSLPLALPLSLALALYTLHLVAPACL